MKNVFKSVPTFFMARDQRMFTSFGKKESFTETEVDEYIAGIQDKTNPDYEEMEDLLFNDTNELFVDLGIMKSVNGRYVFPEVYFRKDETTFLFPTSTTLKKFASGKVSEEELIEANDVKFLQMVVSLSVLRMVALITNFRENIESLKSEEYAGRYMRDAAQKVKGELLVDFNNSYREHKDPEDEGILYDNLD